MGSSITGDPEGYVEEGSGDGHLSIRAPLCDLERGIHLLGTLRIRKNGSELWSISLYGSSVWDTWMGVPLLEALQVMKGRLWGQASLFMGAHLGNLEWARLPWTLRYG